MLIFEKKSYEKKFVTEKERSATAEGWLEKKRDFLGKCIACSCREYRKALFPSRPCLIVYFFY